MRDIIFRGKRVDNGEWAFGYYLFQQKRSKAFGQKITEIDFDKHIISSSRFAEYWEVIPETVGQYTGLTDKNGRKIFEGDIILYHHQVKKLIPCEDATSEEIQHYGLDLESGFGLAYRPTRTIRYKGYVTIDSLWGMDLNLAKDFKWWRCEKNGQLTAVEVIGNIYDNPELLEVCNHG